MANCKLSNRLPANSLLGIMTLVFLTISNNAGAGNFYVSGDLGIANPRQSGFQNSTSFRVAGGYRFEKVGFEVALLDLDEMDYKDLFESYIEVSGYTAHVYWRQNYTESFGVDLGAGLFDWDTDTTLLGLEGSTDSDTGAYFDLRLFKDFTEVFSIYFSTRLFPDVSGADIYSFSAGASVNF